MKLRVMISAKPIDCKSTATSKFGAQLHTINGICNYAEQNVWNHKEHLVTASTV